MGLLIAIEGIDGAGKTTQVGLLGEALKAAGEAVVLSKEPTDGPWGQRIRQSAQTGRLPLEQELEAFVEDRKEHIEHTVQPALADKKIVVLDRYFYSTVAYQGARGADRVELLDRMKSFAPVPDLVLLLDVEPVLAVARIANGRRDIPNEFEKADELTAVRGVFEWLADTEENVCRLDGQQAIANVHRDILEALITGPFKRYQAKPYDCDCFYCSEGATDSCRWFSLQGTLRSRVRQQQASCAPQ